MNSQALAVRADRLGDFVRMLSEAEMPPHMYNQYAPDTPHNAIRRANLRRYLEEMSASRPAVMLVGEAAGYRGCRLSGIPFTSEVIMLAGVPAHDLLGEAKGYRKTTEWPRPVGEQTATIVWRVLASLPQPPLLWNVVPWHPHRPGEPWSNRRPRAEEITLGVPYLVRLAELFNIEQVIAVGRTAAQALERLGWRGDTVRHPAHGGKRDFTRGLRTSLGPCR
ncbi:MAG: uracil-DNA glycosylase [Ardenticatenia bacterium]|nr:uracil-DNA glycosylase [Ardenticatenia bacterium]